MAGTAFGHDFASHALEKQYFGCPLEFASQDCCHMLRCCFACWICECDLHAMLAPRSVVGVACFVQ